MLEIKNAQIDIAGSLITLPNIAIKQGQVIGLCGDSGCGKTTLIKTLAGIIPLKVGRLNRPQYQSGANPVQWLIQQPEFAFNPRLTIEQSLNEAWGANEYQALFDDFDIELQWLQRRPQQLSGGQLQRLNIIRGLLPTTQFLLCDEITAHLDMITQKQIWQSLMLHAKKHHIGLLVVSHDQQLLQVLCESITSLP
ncbi:ATP-binding cassette domain-containing protein [Shewanella marina]|uniref:ATP-binding cassette domain-containing protein n=1 Tax=Shewanella marina TaxID=487319 RepID=UPI00046F289C|nr:ATP-binding cassette domain-containing protein [Shewanella marina]